MGIRAFLAIVIAITICTPSIALPETESDRAKNLATCLSGRYPSLCQRQWLSADQRLQAAAAERRENLRVCLTGKYPSLCRKADLSPTELQQVVEAERRENLRICLTGKYTALCNRGLLTPSQLSQTLAAERSENLRICLTGRYPVLCDKSLLTPEQLSGVVAAERRASETIQSTPRMPPRETSRATGCEAGHWIESVSEDGEIIKLEDGSVWQVGAADTIDSALWLPITDIVICAGKLINTDNNESVSARRIR